jgi:hypothetical protein
VRLISLNGVHPLLAPPVHFDSPLASFVFPAAGPGYVLCHDGSCSPIQDHAKGSAVSEDGPGPMAWAMGDHGRVFVTSGRDAELHEIDLVHHGADRRISLPSRPLALDLAP